MPSIKRIALWGSTGSIGRQTLEVAAANLDRYRIVVLTAHKNRELLLQQAELFRPELVVLTSDPDTEIESRLRGLGCRTLWGRDGLLHAAQADCDLVVNALVGAAGLEATLIAVSAGRPLALANKETLVMAGELVTAEVRKRGNPLLPIDSEHSAIFQCLAGENPASIRRLRLTASGGPFWKRDPKTLKDVRVDEALAHPNWSMGKKITIDSATLMNKALEIIEARWLFGVRPDDIHVTIHPQSIVHSMVEFIDGSIKAQMGFPDMRVPIAYALAYPERVSGPRRDLDFSRPFTCEFFPADPERYSAIRLARQVLEAGGTAPAVLNAADEAAVAHFLSGTIRFTRITELIETILDSHPPVVHPALPEILEADRWARERVDELVKSEKG